MAGAEGVGGRCPGPREATNTRQNKRKTTRTPNKFGNTEKMESGVKSVRDRVSRGAAWGADSCRRHCEGLDQAGGHSHLRDALQNTIFST
ncbi:hypothetical protein E2C01_098314 [Portunus trituberculatus]|uniref:Uncharacterized protein n=1 Tax=Portunus trituberculatus TaxID=210409 RepID=A0A5B7K7D0_PORTR|nr:hypothetical protein [Portunus trituberculatus]